MQELLPGRDHRLPGGDSGVARHLESVLLLEVLDIRAGLVAVVAGYGQVVDVLLGELGLQGLHGAVLRPVAQGLYQERPGVGPDHAAHLDPLGLLEGLHGGDGLGAEDPVGGEPGVPAVAQQVLDGVHVGVHIPVGVDRPAAFGLTAHLRPHLRLRRAGERERKERSRRGQNHYLPHFETPA